MKNIDFNNINNAIQILELGEKETLKDIKKKYKELLIKYHPDKCKEKPKICHNKSQEIIEAYKLILNYINNYQYSFKKEDIEKEQNLHDKDWWNKKFKNDPIWN